MRCASVDIGTNTLRLLIADVEGDRLKPIHRGRVITRLGGGYKEDLGINPLSAERTIDAVTLFARILKEYGVNDVKAVATSVMRRAKNRETFIDEVFKRTGLKVDVITGDEEARLSLLGVLSVIKAGTDFKSVPAFIIDIGGGSTEFIAVDEGKMLGAWSMEMGVVHLTEEYLKSDPPAKHELNAMEDEIKGVIANLKDLMSQSLPSAFSLEPSALFVGTAGTVTTLAALDQALEVYEPERINNYILTYDAVKRMYWYLASLPLKEREKILTLEKGREDLIIPGAAIVLKVMEGFGFDRMTVSDAGLLEGILLEQLQVASHKLQVKT
ncbi:MAG: Ppx/GppA family phosphatase [Deltaproteobacteria bacterium]|nr:Ppx/GppA family phosphatase [Deltaproteobacteria bacterium]